MYARGARQFSHRVLHGKSSGLNITPHNAELRHGISTGKANVVNSFNMGYEGFSSSWHEPRMHQVFGNKGEFLFLALLVPAVLIAKRSRRKNEEGIREVLGTANNRWAPLTKVGPSDL